MSTLVFGVELSNREPGLVGAGVFVFALGLLAVAGIEKGLAAPQPPRAAQWRLRSESPGARARPLRARAGPDRFPTR